MAHRLLRWANIKSTLTYCVVFLESGCKSVWFIIEQYLHSKPLPIHKYVWFNIAQYVNIIFLPIHSVCMT